MTTAIFNPVSILARGVKGAAAGKRAGILADALVSNDDTCLTVTATDLEVCAVASIPSPADFTPGRSIVSTATGEPVAERSPDDFPAVGTLDGDTVATIRTTFGEVVRMADHLLPAVDSESSRYALGGVLIDCEGAGAPAFAVATDGRRMHVARFANAATGAGTAIVSPRLLTAFVAAAKATARAAGRKAPAAGDAVTLTLSTGGASLAWVCGDGHAATIARRMEGRFPDWRRVIGDEPDNVACTVDAARLVPFLRQVTKATTAAAKAAGDAAVESLPAGFRGRDRRSESKQRSARGHAETNHPKGVRLDATGATGRGCPLHDAGTAFPWPICMDATFLADALAGAAAWNGLPAVTIRGTDGQSATRIYGTGAGGASFLAVVMPLAAD